MKPSRPRSNGRLAPSGSSSRRERARIVPNPPSASSVIGDSTPPASIASAIPARMYMVAFPSDMPGRRARRRLGGQRAAGAERHRRLGRAHVRDERRHPERVQPVGARVEELRVGHLLRAQAADAGADRAADPGGVGGDVEVGVARRPVSPRPPRAGRSGRSSGRTSGPCTRAGRSPSPGRRCSACPRAPRTRSMRETPDRPERMPSQVSSIVFPHGVMPPRPVMTTRRRPFAVLMCPILRRPQVHARSRTPRRPRRGTAPRGPRRPVVPSRPSGVDFRIASRAGSGSASVSSVEMYPGATAFTRMPRPPSSLASDFVRPIRPAFDAA